MRRPGLPSLATLATVALLAAVPAVADPPPHARAWGHPSRHDHDVRRVYVVERLPYDHRHVDLRGYRYYYDRRGQWYEPYGAAYVRVAPPAGIVIDPRGIAVVANVPIVRW